MDMYFRAGFVIHQLIENINWIYVCITDDFMNLNNISNNLIECKYKGNAIPIV